MEGYLKLHRQIIESTQFADPIRLKIWIWCLIKANHKNKAVALKTGKGYTTVMVKRGQFIFGRNTASEELNVPPSTVLRHMEKLQLEKAISILSDNQYSIITICKYEQYQSLEEKSEATVNSFFFLSFFLFFSLLKVLSLKLIITSQLLMALRFIA